MTARSIEEAWSKANVMAAMTVTDSAPASCTATKRRPTGPRKLAATAAAKGGSSRSSATVQGGAAARGQRAGHAGHRGSRPGLAAVRAWNVIVSSSGGRRSA